MPAQTLVSVSALKSSRSIQEFRLDFFLEEEFNVDPDFAVHFCRACGLDHDRFEVERTVHSLVDKFGEADLVVLLNAVNGDSGSCKLALLIENKINAGLQPDQAGRYEQRGETGVAEGSWDRYVTVLVAPQSYLGIRRDAGFMAAISIETIRTWVTSSEPARRAFKLTRLDEVIAKKQATGVQIVDADMTRFRKSYYCFLQDWNERSGVALVLPLPGETWWDDSWFRFKAADLPRWVEIRHLARPGRVCLDMRDAVFSSMGALSQALDGDMKLIATGKYRQHTSVELRVPPIRSFDDFEREGKTVDAALTAAKRLLILFRQHRVQFECAYAEASKNA